MSHQFRIERYLPNTLVDKEVLFLKVLRIYWLSYWPVLYLFYFILKISGSGLTGSSGSFIFLLAFFVISAVIMVFSIETLRVIYKEYKYHYWHYSNRHRLLIGFLMSLFFIAWAYLFVISLGARVVLYADGLFGGNLTDWRLDILIFLITIIGEWLFRLNRKIRDNQNLKLKI